jgi:RNA polymerase sigma-70 factor (ECF subfamily)
MEVFPPAPDESGSLDLIKRLQAGDSGAWSELYRRYHDQLLFAARMRLGSRLRAFVQSEDIFQSVARDAFLALRRFEYRGPGSLERYLRQMVLNKIRDQADMAGAQKRAGAVPLDAELADSLAARGSEPHYHDEAAYERLEHALSALPEELREILLLRKIDGLTSQEVAERTGKTDAAVRKAMSRALARLALLRS